MSDATSACPQFQALCCECGTIRTTTTHGATSEAWREPGSRCLVERKCATCGVKRPHAYLRTGPGRNFCEDRERKLPLNLTAEERDWVDDMAWEAVDTIEDWLEAFGVAVRWPEWPSESRDGLLVQDLTDGAYRLALNKDSEPGRVLRVIEYVATALATDSLDPYGWHVVVGAPDNGFRPFRLQVLTEMRVPA